MRLLLAILSLFFLTHCKSPRAKEKWERFAVKADCKRVEKQPFVQAEHVETNIPKTFTGPDDKSVRCIEEYLGIKPLRNGYDSLEIRIWGNDLSALDYKDRLIRIRKTSGRFSADVFEIAYIVDFDATPPVLDSLIGRKRVLPDPHSGWDVLLQTLEQMGIYELPDWLQLSNYDIDTDSGGYSVEFAMKTKYRRYDYPAPKGREILEAKKFVAILDFVETEFGLK